MSENILLRVPGQYIGAALNTLPKAESATLDIMEATIEVPCIGTVRVTAKRFKSKHGKTLMYFWSAEKAVALGQ